MSSTRRTAAPRKRTTGPVGSHLSTPKASEDQQTLTNTSTDVVVGDLDEAKKEILAQVKGALRGQDSGENVEATEEFVASFEQALLELTEDDARKPVSVSNIKETLQSAFHGIGTGSNLLESANEARKLDEAMRGLERRETKIALEFSQRLHEDGQEVALQWLREQLADETDTKIDSAPSPDENPFASRSETVKSRSRRLRGPPKPK